MSTVCLQCGCGVAGEGFEHAMDFCSRSCETAHREKILNRLSELNEGTQSGPSEAWSRGLLSLAETTSNLRYSTADLSALTEEAIATGHGGESTGRLVTFIPAQGGSGASTTALHVAEAIARNSGDRVLLIDYDFHSGTTAFRLGLQVSGVFDDLLGQAPINEQSLERSLNRWGSLDVLVPGSERSTAPLDFSRLGAVMDLVLRLYSFVVVDHPDALYSASRPVLKRSSFVGVVCTPDISALYLVRRKKRAIVSLLGREPAALGLIVNRSTSWGSLDAGDVERVAEARIVASLPNDYAAVRRASWEGGLVEQGSELSAKFLRLADDIRALSGGAPDVAATERVGVEVRDV